MQTLWHWLEVNVGMLAILVTAGVAVLLICCVECCNCSCAKKDELFRRREV